MIVLMGGSGSTGSSLLKNILNRHLSIFAGEETNLFCKERLYLNFDLYKDRIKARGVGGLRNYGYHMYNGIDLLGNGYPIDSKEVDKYLERSSSFKSFCHLLEWHFTLKDQQKIWLEKTPANAASFPHFLSAFPKGKVIHIVRNPADTLASLIARGYNPVYAAGIYLINTASALQYQGDERCYTIKYENLVQHPVQAVSKLCEFLGVPFHPHIIQSQDEVIPNSQLEGWKYDETSEIKSGSVGRYEQSSEKDREVIRQLMNQIEISEKGQRRYGTVHNSFREVADTLDYTLPNLDGKKHTLKLKAQLIKDRTARLRRGYATGSQYPLHVV